MKNSLVVVLFGLLFGSICMANEPIALSESVAPGGMIRGKLLKSNGRPRQYTELELVPVNQDKKSEDMRLWGISNSAGNFIFKNVPVGEYTLSLNFNERPTDTAPYMTIFYPKASKRSDARIFKLIRGSTVSKLRFRLPPSLTRRKIWGKVTLPNGDPVENAYISLGDLEFPMISYGKKIKTNANGTFSVYGFTGWKSAIFVVLFDKPTIGPDSMLIGSGKSKVFIFGSRLKPIKIVLHKHAKPRSRPTDLKTVGSVLLRQMSRAT